MASRPFIPVPNVYEAELRFQLGSVVMVNRLVYEIDTLFTIPPTQLEFTGQLGTTVINKYLPAIAQNVLFNRVRTRTLTTSSDPWVTIDYTGYFGLWPSDALSANVTCYARMATGRRAGIKVGAICVPAPPRDAVVENEFTDAYLLQVRDAMGWLQEPLFTVGYELGWVSYRENGAWRSEGVFRQAGISSPNRIVAPRRRRLRNTNILP